MPQHTMQCVATHSHAVLTGGRGRGWAGTRDGGAACRGGAGGAAACVGLTGAGGVASSARGFRNSSPPEHSAAAACPGSWLDAQRGAAICPVAAPATCRDEDVTVPSCGLWCCDGTCVRSTAQGATAHSRIHATYLVVV